MTVKKFPVFYIYHFLLSYSVFYRQIWKLSRS